MYTNLAKLLLPVRQKKLDVLHGVLKKHPIIFTKFLQWEWIEGEGGVGDVKVRASVRTSLIYPIYIDYIEVILLE